MCFYVHWNIYSSKSFWDILYLHNKCQRLINWRKKKKSGILSEHEDQSMLWILSLLLIKWCLYIKRLNNKLIWETKMKTNHLYTSFMNIFLHNWNKFWTKHHETYELKVLHNFLRLTFHRNIYFMSKNGTFFHLWI